MGRLVTAAVLLAGLLLRLAAASAPAATSWPAGPSAGRASTARPCPWLTANMTKNGPPWPLTVPAGRKCGECVNGLNGYPLLYGSIIKFPPPPTDGSMPEGGMLGPVLAKKVASAASLAVSPDDKWVYATGLYNGYRGTYWEKCKWHHLVYRAKWDDKTATPFLGTLHEPGNDGKHFNDPRSVATDAEGRLYVADRGNDRIAVFNADGKYLGQLNVPKPSWVEVNPKTGAIYVMSCGRVNTLVKFSGWQDAKELARATFPNRIDGGRRHLWPVMTLDSSADPPVIWLGSTTGYPKFRLIRVEDRGNSLGKPLEVTRLATGRRVR